MDFFPQQYQDESRTRRQRRNQILQTAFDLFISHGLTNASMQMIAQEARVERRTLYNYYPHKDQLAMDIQIVLLADHHAALRLNHDDAQGSEQEIHSYLTHVVAQLIKQPQMVDYFAQFDLLYRDYENPEYEQFIIELAYSDPLVELMRKGVNNGHLNLKHDEIGIVAKTIGNALVGLAQRILIRPQVYLREQNYRPEDIHQLVNLIVKGLTADPLKK